MGGGSNPVSGGASGSDRIAPGSELGGASICEVGGASGSTKIGVDSEAGDGSAGSVGGAPGATGCGAEVGLGFGVAALGGEDGVGDAEVGRAWGTTSGKSGIENAGVFGIGVGIGGSGDGCTRGGSVDKGKGCAAGGTGIVASGLIP